MRQQIAPLRADARLRLAPVPPASDPTAPVQPGEPAAQAEATAWTLWGRGTTSGFDGNPKDDFRMDGNVFTSYPGLDYRLGGRIELGEWIDLNVEGERTTQGGGAEHLIALYGYLG